MPRRLALLLVFCLGFRSAPAPADSQPKLWLWAWERPEDLRFLAGEPKVGVAALVRTVQYGPRGVEIVPRRQPLLLGPGMKPRAVVRLEVAREWISTRPPSQGDVEAIARAIVEVTERDAFDGLQLDYDARASELTFEAELVTLLRAKLGPMPLGRTRLAAKCLHEAAVTGPAAEASEEIVPMLFSMGPDRNAVTLGLRGAGDFPNSSCRHAMGIMAGDSLPSFAHDRPTYLFSRSAWTRDVFEKATRQIL